MLLYKRNVQVIVGDDESAIKIENLKITFDVKKLVSSKSAEGTVSIYNLNKDSTAQIKQTAERIRILAGYGDNLALLHDGEIRRIERVNEGFDRITVITFGGALFKTEQAVFSKSYNGTVKVKDIVKDALPTFNLGDQSNFLLDKIPEFATLSDFSYAGKTSSLLSEILTPLNIQWFENNKKINGFVKNEPLDNQRVYVLNSNTGLIKTAVNTDRGVNAVALLNPKLEVGSTVKIESSVITNTKFLINSTKDVLPEWVGFYKIVQVMHVGSNRDGQFESQIQCVMYNGN